jgi:iron complex outermembrane receptor protein
MISTSGSALGIPDGIPVKFLVGDLYDNTHQYSDELQLRGLSFNEKLDWLAGLFYLKSKPSGVGGNLVAFADPLISPTSGYNFITQTSKAVFVNGKYDLSSILLEGLKFNAGIRYTKDETESCVGAASASGLYDEGDCKSGTGLANTGINTAKSNATTWNVGLDWQVDPDLFTYIVARRGYRAGGANGPTLGGTLAQFQTFEPDTVTDVEIGLRSDIHFGDALLRTNLSVFSGWYDKVQLPFTGLSSGDPRPVGCNTTVNPDGDCNTANDPAGGTLLDYGFTFAPDEHWTFDVGGTFLKLETIKVDLPDFLRARMSNPDELPFNYAAKKSVTSSVRYEFPLRNNMGDVALNLKGTSGNTEDCRPEFLKINVSAYS